MLSRIHQFHINASFNPHHPVYDYLENINSPNNKYVKLPLCFDNEGRACMTIPILKDDQLLDLLENNMMTEFVILKELINQNNQPDQMIRNLSQNTEFHEKLLCNIIENAMEMYPGKNILFLGEIIDMDQFYNLPDDMTYKEYIDQGYQSHSILLAIDNNNLTVYDPDDMDEPIIKGLDMLSMMLGKEFVFHDFNTPIQTITNDYYCMFHSILMIMRIMNENPQNIKEMIEMFEQTDQSNILATGESVRRQIINLEDYIIGNNI